MEVNFLEALFKDEYRATLNNPNGWRKGWVVNERDLHNT